MKIVPTPLDGQAPRLQQAELRAAAGAEGQAAAATPRGAYLSPLDRIRRNIAPDRPAAPGATPPPVDDLAKWRERHGW
jgi:hypothetical protein